MNVLLTGGAGYIGSHTAVELLNRGCDIVIADDYSNSSPVAVERIRQITGRDFPAYHVDVTDREAVRRIFRENKIVSFTSPVKRPWGSRSKSPFPTTVPISMPP